MRNLWSGRKSKDVLNSSRVQETESLVNVMSATNEAKKENNPTPKFSNLMLKVLERENMLKALQRVEKNKGSAGVDEMKTTDLREHLKSNWVSVRSNLLDGTYNPSPVREVEIPKANGKKRKLGIPTVLDRLIQQAIAQVLNQIFDPNFSESSFGFREKRSAQGAIKKAKKHVTGEGKQYVVDIDLAQFFDEINHDRLMGKLAKVIDDSVLLKLIKKYLKAGIMKELSVSKRDKGTPQGGPLSPLLSNIVLDELDKELEKRGLSFCRFADDCNIYVKSKRSAERILDSLTNFIEKKLKLLVNKEKSKADRVTRRKFLGYSFYSQKSKFKLRVASESLTKFKSKIKLCFRGSRGRNLSSFIKTELNPILRGWINYFILAEGIRFAEELDGWIRRKLRCNKWRQWKRGGTRMRKLQSRGLDKERAVISSFNQRGPWWNSGQSHMNTAFPKSYFDKWRLVSFRDRLLESRSLTT